jgi:hypothetical protein
MSLAGSCFSTESALRPLYGAFLVKKFKQGSASFSIASFFVGSEVRWFFPTLASFAWRFSGRAFERPRARWRRLVRSG